jgi:hypothetical protein
MRIGFFIQTILCGAFLLCIASDMKAYEISFPEIIHPISTCAALKLTAIA